MFLLSDLRICAEIYAPISHNLLSCGTELSQIKRVYSCLLYTSFCGLCVEYHTDIKRLIVRWDFPPRIDCQSHVTAKDRALLGGGEVILPPGVAPRSVGGLECGGTFGLICIDVYKRQP